MFNIFKPKWQHDNRDIRLAAIEKLKDQEKLRQIVMTDQDSTVRHAALDKINDSDPLYNIISDELIKSDDNRKLKEAVLYLYLMYTRDEDNRGPDNIEFDRVIAEIDSIFSRALVAYSKSNKRNFNKLKKLAFSGVNWLGGRKGLTVIGQPYSELPYVNIMSLSTFKTSLPDALINRIVFYNSDWELLNAVIESTDSQALLEKMAFNCRYEFSRFYAASRLDNDEIYKTMAISDSNYKNRAAAIERIDSKQILSSVLETLDRSDELEVNLEVAEYRYCTQCGQKTCRCGWKTYATEFSKVELDKYWSYKNSEIFTCVRIKEIKN